MPRKKHEPIVVPEPEAPVAVEPEVVAEPEPVVDEAAAQRRADVESALLEGANPKGFSAENKAVYAEILAEQESE